MSKQFSSPLPYGVIVESTRQCIPRHDTYAHTVTECVGINKNTVRLIVSVEAGDGEHNVSMYHANVVVDVPTNRATDVKIGSLLGDYQVQPPTNDELISMMGLT